MPLRDHFRPPVLGRLPWQSLHHGWIGELTARLNTILPRGFLALDTVRAGAQVEVDVGAYELEAPDSTSPLNEPSGGVAVAPVVWTPPAATGSFPAVFPDTYEVQVYAPDLSGTLVGAIELISPSNKDREPERQAFAAKCAAYLNGGASVVILDVVTNRKANLHNEILRLLDAPLELDLTAGAALYAAAYRPVTRDAKPQIDVWTATFVVGDRLPTMPLRLTDDLFAPVEFEETYTETCRRRRLM
jgi:hypothetical protein